MGVVYDDLMIYYIPEANLGQFEKRIARLIKRANKLKAALSYKIDRDEFEDRKHEFETADGKVEKWVRYIKVTVDGDRPQIPGWSFIGTLEHTEEGNILRMVPGEIAPEKYRDTAPVCEHCKLKRTRRDTFLVRSQAGEVSQVGSNCLVDFLGHENPHQLAQLSTIWINIDELTKLAEDVKWTSGGGGGISVERHDLLQFLSIVAELTTRYGFFSKSYISKLQQLRGPDANLPEITAWHASRLMLGGSRKDREDANSHIPSEESVKMAEDAREWALREFGMAMPDGSDVDDIKAAVSGVAGRELTDFEHNLFVVAKGEAVERRTFGIAAYLIQAYRKANNLIPAKAAPAVPSQHFGTIGQRLMKLSVKCEKIHFWNSEQFGQGCLQKMRTAEGNVVVWRTYNIADCNLMEEGQEFVINATIKKHGEFNGEKQTEVSRMKIVSGKQQPPAPPSDDKPLIETSLTAPQPENVEPGDDFIPTGLQLVAA